ncbi:ribosome biogenesis GTPase Der [Phreatobacter oligotrophus]|jgi:GTPase|uniref:ribosome biogenesis GTPase Der n=1 Tax=Phreatobacter oligotrophus TaxID=1122261 RepID=UPI002354B67B|nr:ribosome biogenesis GTPase Der [Phreatobacter oligotrophus]MBX9988997.1 ribosome biogenesis GTPase Der [Phreatobacter oligotrophus]
MSFTLAIVGRPNVGKSTLFNRLVGQRIALVDDRPGVTRDRREGDASLGDLAFTIIDTAGLEDSREGSLESRMRAQTEEAIRLADAILFMVDARIGLTPDDQTFAEMVRKSGKPVILAANKIEGKVGMAGAYEAFSLGLGDPVPLSAEHGEGLNELYDALAALMPPPVHDDEPEDDEDDSIPAGDQEAPPEDLSKPIPVAIVGRPNAGKSTLVNALIGEDRLLTGPEAGITRDAIAVDWEWGGRKFRLVDTAGLRKRARIEDKLEKLSVADALRAIRFAEVVVVCMDAEKPFEDQDLRIADLAAKEGRAVVLAFTKWDLVPHKGGKAAKLREEADHWLPQIKGCPVVANSAATGQGLDRVMQAIIDARVPWQKRISTNTLVRWLQETVDHHPPPAVSGRRIKLRYMTQAKVRPPTFVTFCSRPEALPESYLRYLVNGLRESFDLQGTPIRFHLKKTDNPYAETGRKIR